MVKILFLLLFLAACSKDMPHKSFDNATHFNIEYFDNYKILRINEAWNGDTGERVWVLLDSATNENTIPDSLRKHVKIRLPAKRVVVLSTSVIAFMESLELSDRIIAIDNRNLIYSEKMQNLIDSLEIKEVGSGSLLNLESLLMLKPDIVFTFGTGSNIYDDFPRLSAAGLPVVLTAEWMENHPIARLEWIKVIAVLLGKEAEADSVFKEISYRYDSLSVLAKKASYKPTVLTGYPEGSEWLAGGGKSYFAKFLKDAGAAYIFENSPKTGIINLNLESALLNGVNADYWLHPSLWKSYAEILKNEPRIQTLGAWKKHTIYQNSLRTSKKGAVDFYESGIVHPDEILADLIGIFHPDILPERKFTYYIKLE